MIYQVSTAINTYGMVEYDHKLSAPYDLFLEGTSLAGMALDLRYTVKKKGDADKLAKAHLVQSTGPDLVSNAFRAVIERVAPAQAEFFDADISFKGSAIAGFRAMNLVHRVACVDLEKSEYKVTNFDPHHPTYLFLYSVLRDAFESDLDIVRSQELSPAIVVGEALKIACVEAKLHGLLFCRTVDRTHRNRSICERS